MYFATETRVSEEVFCGQKFTYAPRCISLEHIVMR